MLINERLTSLIEETFEHLWNSPNHFTTLNASDVFTLPIPFFGRVDTAQILTVGGNPSPDELPVDDWPEQLTTAELTTRLLDYFQRPKQQRRDRFSTWEEALNTLGCSYYDGSAAHIDISPRVTPHASQCDPYLFVEMCRYDVSRMFTLLATLTRPRVLLMAGAVGDDYDINDFLRQVAGENDWALIGEGHTKGSGRIGYHSLFSEETAYDAFFCSVSPGNPTKGNMLPSRVAEHSEWIQMLIP